jgi:hypothetical protein
MVFILSERAVVSSADLKHRHQRRQVRGLVFQALGVRCFFSTSTPFFCFMFVELVHRHVHLRNAFGEDARE